MVSLLVDTGFLVALYIRGDTLHFEDFQQLFDILFPPVAFHLDHV